MLISENRWRAQRYGVEGSLMDYGKGRLVAYGDLVDEIIALVREDALELGCLDAVERARDIVAGGTSAERQLSTYRAAIEAGRPVDDALRDVVDELIEDTRTGL
jgi:carboxylate-amine ligase